MERKSLSGLTMLTLLLVGMWTLAFNVGQAESSVPPPTEWTRTYGGLQDDYGYSLVQTDDGGYAIAGDTGYFDPETGSGPFDILLVKTDSAGNMLWNQTYGGKDDEGTGAIIQTSEGGYAIAGYTNSTNTDPFLPDIYDFLLVKADSTGNMLWTKTYGGSGEERASSVVQAADGGYAIAGYTIPSGPSSPDFWLVKTDSAGNAVWNKTYGGTSADVCYSVQQTSDGGYALTGYTSSFGAYKYDVLLVKTDSNGNVVWTKTYGFALSREVAYSLVQTGDGGYALAGYYTVETAGLPPLPQFLLIKTDSAGNLQWWKTYNRSANDIARSLVQAFDGGYAIAGRTKDAYGLYDGWLVKTDSSGNSQWNETYGGADYDQISSAVQTSDLGYALAGYTFSYGSGDPDFWLIKVAPERDVAVTGIAVSKTVVGKGYSVSIDVTVQNQGVLSETFDVNAYYGGNIIGTQTVTNLPPGASTTVPFMWNTTGVALGNYAISAYATPVPDETDTADNTLNGGTVSVVTPGDVNADGVNNVADVAELSAHWYPGPPIGPSGYGSNADINGDGTVDLADFAIVSAYWTGPPKGPLAP